jgi:cytochrome b561
MLRTTANPPTGYSLLTRLLHWCVALFVLGQIGLGWWMVGLGYYDPWYYDSRALHEAVGIAAWLLAIMFVVRNLVVRPPSTLPMPRWEIAAAWLAHRLLYFAILALPIAGYLMSTADGNPLELFGGLALPAIAGASDRVREVATVIHTDGSYALLALVCLHAAAALKHHFYDRDATLRRMLVRH